MDRELICSVLGVSPEHWPPDHYTLIGLRPSDAEPAAVEARVHDLSTRLRPYQLAHPDAVTEALNRLAQALVCLTDPQTREAYDSSFRDLSFREPTAPLGVMPPDPIARPAPTQRPEPPAQPSPRRTTYRRLVVARRLRTAWREAGAVIGQPWWRLHDRAEALELVRSLWQVRDCAADEAKPSVAALGQPGALVVAISRRGRLLHDLRRLTPDERDALAADWRSGLTAIEHEIRLLRASVRRRNRLPRPFVRSARYFVGEGLDVTLFLLGLAAIAIALYRSKN